MNLHYKILIIAGITEAVKQYGIPSAFSPTIAIILGALLSFFEKPNPQGVLEGVILGATVTGIYALIKRLGRALLPPFIKKPDYSLLEPDDDRGV